MALFSRRKKSDSTPAPAEVSETPAAEEPVANDTEAAPVEEAPVVNISVQQFRGVGAQAGREVALDEQGNPAPNPAPAQQQPVQPAQQQATPTPPERPLPLAPIAPPEQTQSVKGMPDNVLLRETLARLDDDVTNEQLIGVLRQMLQGHLILRVQGNAQEQIAQGGSLSIGILRDGERNFMLAFSSARALQDLLKLDDNPTQYSAVTQPVMGVLHQVIAGGLDGLILDNASAPHRVVFPTDVLKRAVEQADPQLALKTVLAVPHASGAEAPVASAIADSRLWVAGGEGPNGQIGIAEMRAPDGTRYLQLFSHPLEVIALGRGERPLPFSAEQLGKVLIADEGLSGVVVDPAGPSVVVRREALGEVIAKASEESDAAASETTEEN